MKKIEPIDFNELWVHIQGMTISDGSREIMRALINKMNEIVEDYNKKNKL
jgi:hypothetical protein